MVRDRVLITRPPPGAERTEAMLAARGLRGVIAPFLVITPLAASPNDPGAGDVQAILVTSANAIPALPSRLFHVPLLAVGDATAACARDAGFASFASADGDAAALAALTAARCDPAAGPLLLATGRGHGAALAADLRARGFTVAVRTVYASDPVRHFPDLAAATLAEGRLRAALFFSAAAARAFAATLPRAIRPALAAVDALAIADAAARPIAPLPWRAVRAALHPTQDELLALL